MKTHYIPFVDPLTVQSRQLRDWIKTGVTMDLQWSYTYRCSPKMGDPKLSHFELFTLQKGAKYYLNAI